MRDYKVSDTISLHGLNDADYPPAGTVLIPSDGSQPRVISRFRENPDVLHFFTDKTGFYAIESFTVAYVPETETSSVRDDLAATLTKIWVDGPTGGDDNRFVRMADHVLENFDRKKREIIAVIDGDGDRWEPMHNVDEQFECVSEDLCDRTLEEIEDEFGPIERVYAS